jgi:glycosyltransferase involved in cell wall biosynthesis
MIPISIIVTIYNTNPEYFKDCLDSISYQEGNFNIELVVVDDASSEYNFNKYKELLDNLENKKNKNNIIKVLLHRLDTNSGIGYASRIAVELCSNEIIYKQDSDDIMLPTRLQVQWDFMQKNPDYPLCSGDTLFFKKINNKIITQTKTNHPEILTWEYYKNNVRPDSNWFTNQPLFCFRKSCILAVGNYDADLKYYEDTIMVAKILNKYGKIYNIKITPCLLLYRLHDSNTTDKIIYKDTILKNLMIDKLKYYLNNKI